MEIYPLVSELLTLAETRQWDWNTFDSTHLRRKNFYVGTDEVGNSWITKMRRSFLGYREIVFERLVQRAGWLCQSSSFAILERTSPPRQMNPKAERIQLVTRLLSEHESTNCGPDCPIGPLRGNLYDLGGDPVELLAASPIEDVLNKARKEILAPLLGGSEQAGCLTTIDHRVFRLLAVWCG